MLTEDQLDDLDAASECLEMAITGHASTDREQLVNCLRGAAAVIAEVASEVDGTDGR